MSPCICRWGGDKALIGFLFFFYLSVGYFHPSCEGLLTSEAVESITQLTLICFHYQWFQNFIENPVKFKDSPLLQNKSVRLGHSILVVVGVSWLIRSLQPRKGLRLLRYQHKKGTQKKATFSYIFLHFRPQNSSTCRHFQASRAVEQNHLAREANAHNDAGGLLLPVPGWAEDDPDMESVIKKDKPQ